MGEIYDAAEFLDTPSYQNVLRWAKVIKGRDAVKKGMATAL